MVLLICLILFSISVRHLINFLCSEVVLSKRHRVVILNYLLCLLSESHVYILATTSIHFAIGLFLADCTESLFSDWLDRNIVLEVFGFRWLFGRLRSIVRFEKELSLVEI